MFSKKYKKGMADAAKAYEAFGKKQEDALKHILEEVREGKRNLEDALKDLDGNINNLYDYLQSKEKANLYTVYTPFDIAELDKMEKLFLAGALLSLAWDKTPTEAQKKFNSSILRYLDIKDPPSGINVLAIEHIDSTSAQKAIYQVILEYLILQNSDSYDETELQQSFLDTFNLNTKARESIAKYVELLYLATGSEGLAEKYGYVVEEENESADNNITDSSEEEKRLEKEAAFIVLKEDYNIKYNKVILKDYIWYRSGGSDHIVNKNTSSIENIDWIDIRGIGDTVVFENLCCATDYVNDKTFLLNFDNQKSNLINFSKRVKLLTMNQQWLIAIDNSNNNLIVYDLNSNAINTFNVWGDSAYIFDDVVYIINHSTVFKCNLATNEYEKIFDIFELSDELKKRYDYSGSNGRIRDSLIYQNKLYLLGEVGEWSLHWNVKKIYIYSIPLDNPTQYENVADNIYAYQSMGGSTDLFKFDSGWVFIIEDEKYSCSPKFYLAIFSCETNDIKKLAKGCGEKNVTKAGLFKNKTEFYRKTLKFFKWNNFVFFDQAAGSFSCVNINEPMNIIVVE